MTDNSIHNNVAALLTQPTVLIPVSLLVIAASIFLAYGRLAPPSLEFSQTNSPGLKQPSLDIDLDIQDIASMSLFGAVSVEEPAPQNDEDIPETNLRLVLKGAFAHSSDAKANALIARDMNSPAELFFIDDTLPGGAKLDKVHANYVVIRRSGQLEKLQFQRSQANNSYANNIAVPQYTPSQQYNAPASYNPSVEEDDYDAPPQSSFNLPQKGASNNNSLAEIRERIRQRSQN